MNAILPIDQLNPKRPSLNEAADSTVSVADAENACSSENQRTDSTEDEPFVTEFHFRASSVSPGALHHSKGVRYGRNTKY